MFTVQSTIHKFFLVTAMVIVGLMWSSEALAYPIREEVSFWRDVFKVRESIWYRWNIAYTKVFDGTNLIKEVRINFVFDCEYTPEEKRKWKKKIAARIEDTWNNKFHIIDLTCNRIYPLGVRIIIDKKSFHHEVNLRKGPGRSDMLNWYQDDWKLICCTAWCSCFPEVDKKCNSVMAHEVGHMIGLYDEYPCGAVENPESPLISYYGLMGYGALKPPPPTIEEMLKDIRRPESLYVRMYPRYYQQYWDYLNRQFPDRHLELRVVPEPLSIFLFLLGGGALLRFSSSRSFKK